MPQPPNPKDSRDRPPTSGDIPPHEPPPKQQSSPQPPLDDAEALRTRIAQLEADLAARPDLEQAAAAEIATRVPARAEPMDKLRAYRDDPKDPAKKDAAIALLKRCGPLALDRLIYTAETVDGRDEVRAAPPKRTDSTPVRDVEFRDH